MLCVVSFLFKLVCWVYTPQGLAAAQKAAEDAKNAAQKAADDAKNAAESGMKSATG